MENEIKENFLNTFELLSRKQQKIWRYLQKYSQENVNVFPLHREIARKCKCHRDTVVIATNKFKLFKWLRVVKRAYSSNLYFIAEEFLNIDTYKKRNIYRKTRRSIEIKKRHRYNVDVL